MEKAIQKIIFLFLHSLHQWHLQQVLQFLLLWVSTYHSVNLQPVTDAKFVGLKNYLRVFSDPTFMHALWFTALFTIVSVLTINVFAFVIAMLLTKGIKGTNFFRTVFFMPNLIGGIVLGYIWQHPAEWNLRSFWKNTYLFFFLWILGLSILMTGSRSVI